MTPAMPVAIKDPAQAASEATGSVGGPNEQSAEQILVSVRAALLFWRLGAVMADRESGIVSPSLELKQNI